MLATGRRAGLEELAERVRLPGAVSASPTVKGSALVGVSSFGAWLAIGAMGGGAVIAATVSWKVVVVVSWPSLTVRVTVVEPVRPGAGERVTERLAPAPPKAMLATGRRV